eukprot:TRINITY_DN12407_c0_g1_i1.p1 TRINITY_DN12407_c0_g1~~TRINITY_DN12407_c0_g1_i1.p1  ORF type:complete len:629 (-),score=87.33 TRINITY_DN12407_c0_g1_i1:87-1973(-)
MAHTTEEYEEVISKLQAQLDQAQQKNLAYEADLANFGSKLTHGVNEIQSQADQLQEHLSSDDQNIGGVAEQLAMINDRVVKKLLDIYPLPASDNAEGAALARLRQENQALNDKIDMLTSVFTTKIGAAIHELVLAYADYHKLSKSSNDASKMALSGLYTCCLTVTAEVNKILKQTSHDGPPVDDKDKTIKELNEQLNALRREKQTSDDQSRKASCKMAELVFYLQQHQGSILKCIKDFNSPPQQAEKDPTQQQQPETCTIEEELRRYKFANTKLQHDNANIQRELDSLVSEFGNMEKKKREMESEMMALNSTIMVKLSQIQQQKREFEERVVKDLTEMQVEHYESQLTELKEETKAKGQKLVALQFQYDRTAKDLGSEIERLKTRLARDRPHPKRNEGFDQMYKNYFQGRGMNMIWECTQCVYEHEYTAALPVNDEDDNEENINEADNRFKDAFDKQIVQCIYTLKPVGQNIGNMATLKEMYIKNCNQMRVKPNSAVLRLLPGTPVHGDIVCNVHELNLGLNLLGDNGLQAFLPMLTHFPRLHTLGLADNGIRNAGIKELVDHVKDHPTLTSLDVSNNRITRAGGKCLLELLSLNRRIKNISLDNTQLEEAMQAKIYSIAHGRVPLPA